MNTSLRASHRPLRAAVVGSGAISKEHLTFLSGRSQAAGDVTGRIELAAVCDLSPVAADYGATEFGAGRAYTDITEMLKAEDLDVVHILTPPASHVTLATLCLEAGANVICEKPITSSAADLEQLLGVAQRCNRAIMESHNYRFNDGYLTVREALDAGRLGDLTEVEIRICLPVTDPDGRFGDPNLPSPIHRMPAGVLHDFTTHFAYLLLGLTGDVKFNRVAAAWSNHRGVAHFRYDDLDALLIGEGPTGPVHGRLRFDAGSAPDAFSLTARGSRGWMETDFFQPHLRTVIPRPGGAQLSPIVNHVANGLGLVRDGVTNFGRKLLQQTPYHGLHRMLDETYGALADGAPLPVSPGDMLAAARLVDQLLDDEVRL
ncbi:MAG: Gfo/Idh/MocA family oxidoreductase [Acidimicrobiia bacterium]|nr:Gfo/Idh/MocA family oxidoreductase [Acidimicrobiia bacterium]